MSDRPILIIGSGRSALEVAKEVVAQGARAVLARSGKSSRACALRIPGGIEVLDGAKVMSLEGSVGRFTVHLRSEGDDFIVDAGAVVVAEEPGAVQNSHPGTPVDGWTEVALSDVQRVAVVLGPYASRRDHLDAIRLAAALRERSHPPEVTIFAGEMLVRGAEELEYLEAQRAGARFVRTLVQPTIVTVPDIIIKALDEPTGIEVELHPDILFTEGLEPIGDGPSAIEAARGSVSMGVAVTVREGVLLCRPTERGLAESDLITEAKAAATRAISLAQGYLDRAPSAAKVDRDRCSACLTCVRTCPFHAPRIDEEGKAVITAELCQACGCCVAACPSKAISLPADEVWTTALRPATKVMP